MKFNLVLIVVFFAITWQGCGKDKGTSSSEAPQTKTAEEEIGPSVLDNVSPYVENSEEVKPGDSVQIYAGKLPQKNITYEWRLIAPEESGSILNDAKFANPVFVPDKKGTYVAWLVAKAGKHTSKPIPITIRVKNRVPIAMMEISKIQTPIVGSVFQIDGSKSSDPDQDRLYFSWNLQRPDGSKTELASTSVAQTSFKADKKGEYKIQLLVSDGESQSDIVEKEIEIINSAPTFKAIMNRFSATLDDTVDFSLSQPFDLDGDILSTTWKIKGIDDLKEFALDLSGEKQHFKATKRGKYEIQAAVTDGTAVVASSILKLTVINRNPVADLKMDVKEATVGRIIHLDARGSTDPDGDEFNVKWVINDGEKTLEGKESSYTVATKKTQKIKLEVSDGLGGKTTKEDSIRIINQSPRAIILAVPLKGSVGEVFHLFSHGGADLDGDPLTHQWEIRDKEDGSMVSSKSGVEMDISFSKKSSYEVRLTVSDGDTIVRSEPVTLYLENRPPKAIASVTPEEAHIFSKIRLQSLTEDDPDGDQLSTSWKIKKPGGDLIELQGIENSFEVVQSGTYDIILSVTDGFGFSEDHREVHVANEKPVAVASASPTTMVGRELVKLDGTKSYDTDTEDQGRLTYKWQLINQPSGSSVALGVDEIKSQLSFLPTHKGTYNVELIVSDGVSKSDPSHASIAVDNRPPEITSLTSAKSAAFIDEGVVIAAQARSDSGISKFMWKVDSDKASLSRADSTSSSPIFKAIEPGHYNVSLVVNDGESDSAPDIISIDVLNRKPVIESMSVTPLHVNQGGKVTLSATASDPDIRQVALISYEWNLLDDQDQVIKSLSGKMGEFEIPERKSYHIELKVTDSFDTVGQSKSIMVDNAAPVITGIKMDPTAIYLNDFLTLSAQVDDLEKDSLVYAWSVKDSLGAEILKTDQKIMESPRFEISSKGKYDVKLILTDAQGAKSERIASFTTLNKSVTLTQIYAKTSPYMVGQQVSLSSDALDPDSDTLQYAWEVWKGTLRLETLKVAEPIFMPPSYGEYVIKLKVTDSMDSASTETKFATQNRDPANAQIKLLTEPIIFNKPIDAQCIASDLDLDALTCEWQLIKPNGVIELKTKNLSENVIFIISDFGDHELRLIVKDPQGGQTQSVVQSFRVENHAPKITGILAQPDAIYKGQLATLTADVQDLESTVDKLTIEWKLSVLNESLKGKSVTFTPQQKGPIPFTLIVKDEQGLEVSQLSSFTVVNAAPKLGEISFDPKVDIIEGLARLLKGASYTLGIPVQNIDNDQLTFSWMVSGGATLENSEALNSKMTGSDYGSFAVSVAVSDGEATETKSQNFRIQSRPPTAAIVLDPLGEIETLGEVKMKGTILDPDGDAVTSTWSIELPGGVKQSLQSTGNQVTYVPNVAGIYKVELVVTDISGAQAKANAEFTVSSGKAWGDPAPTFFSGFIGCYHPKQYGETEDSYYNEVLSRKGFFRLSPQMRPNFEVYWEPQKFSLVSGGASQASIPKSWAITNNQASIPGAGEAGKISINSKYIGVADRYNHRIQIFDKKECLEKSNQPVYQTFYGGIIPGGSSSVYAVPNNEVCFCMPKYVLGKIDPSNVNKNVLGANMGEFNEPIDTVFVEEGDHTDLWVSDTKNKRLQIFNMNNLSADPKVIPIGYEPRSLAVFKDKIYVVNAVMNSDHYVTAGKIDVYDHNGNILAEIPLKSVAPRLVKGIGNIEATDDGILFVTVWDGSSYHSRASVRAFDANTFVVLSSIDLTRSPDSQFSGYTEWMGDSSATSFTRGLDFGAFKRGELVIGHGSLPSIVYQREGDRLKNCEFRDASVQLPPLGFQASIRYNEWLFKHFFTSLPPGKSTPITNDLFYYNVASAGSFGSGIVGAYGNHIYVANLGQHFIMVHRRNVLPKEKIIGPVLRDVSSDYDKYYHYFICNEPTEL